MRNLLFKAAFDGSSFHGWQIQENATTIQGEIYGAFERLTGEKPNIIGCSRTDAGVHANEYYFNIRTESNIPADKFPIALMSAKLPGEIAIYDCKEVDYDFNARFDCVKKEYIYVIENTDTPSPFNYRRALNYKYPIDVELMNKACRHFIGEHDFSAFCAVGAQVKTKTRIIYDSYVEKNGNKIIFHICGNGFLYNMVRIIAGTLLYVCGGKINEADIPLIIESKDRSRAGITAPPEGLYLNKVYFSGEEDES